MIGEYVGWLISGIALVGSYLVPFWIALARGHQNPSGVFAVNFLFGWTAVGWLAALAWAFEKPDQD